jgi:polyisoprenoid-binding protein YceI
LEWRWPVTGIGRFFDGAYVRRSKGSNHMANQIAPATFAATPRLRSPIELRIKGEDLFVSGRFHRWQATVALGSDLDQLVAQIAIDATSPDNLTSGAHADEQNLFAFTSNEVTPGKDGGYRAQGRLVTPNGDFPLSLDIQVPDGHTAFFLIAGKLDRASIGDGWSELVTGSGKGGIDAERLLDPRTGVRDLPVAAA